MHTNHAKQFFSCHVLIGNVLVTWTDQFKLLNDRKIIVENMSNCEYVKQKLNSP